MTSLSKGLGLLGLANLAESDSASPGLLGMGNPSGDPLSSARMALYAGLISGNYSGGLLGYAREKAAAGPRQLAQLANHMELQKGALELQQYRDAIARNRAIQEERARLGSGETAGPALSPTQGAFSTPTIGEVPMFSLGTQPAQNATRAPTSGAASENETAKLYKRLLQEADLYSRHGDTKTALELYQRAEQFRPKYSLTPQVMKDQRTNQLVQLVLDDAGGHRVLPFGAKPDISIEDLGDRKVALDRNELQGGQSWGKGMTHSDRIAAGNLHLSRQRFAMEANAPHYVQTDEGLYAVPKNASMGARIVGVPIAGADGQTLRSAGRVPAGYRQKADGSLEPIPGGPASTGKALPTKIVSDLAEQTSIADSTQRFVSNFRDGYGGKTILGDLSNTIGRVAGDDTGQAQFWQDYQLHESQIRNKLFGASLTTGEQAQWNKLAVTPRMDPQQIRLNLQRRSEIENRGLERLMNQAEKAGYNREQIEAVTGRPVSSEQRSAAPAAASRTDAQPMPANPSASDLKIGAAYQLPNGKVGVWDGFRFKVQK